MGFLNKSSTDVLGAAQAKMEEIKILIKPDMTAEDKGKVAGLTEEVKAMKTEALQLSEIEKLATEIKTEQVERPAPGQSGPSGFKTLGDFAQAIWRKRFDGLPDPRLGRPFIDPNEPDTPTNAKGWVESKTKGQKDLVENIGASGGFLVPIEQRTELLQVPGPEMVVRPRATVVPMTRRQIQWPTLDQTNTTAGRPA
jgi:HK97 family phage major capsid protein